MIVLAAVIAALLVFIYLRERAFIEERREFMTAFLSKNSIEFSTAESIAKPKKDKKKETQREFVPTNELSDEEFFKAIEKTVN